MKRFGLSLVCLLWAVPAMGEAPSPVGLEAQLISMKEGQLVGEMWDLHLSLVNNGTAPVDLEPSFLVVRLDLKMHDEWIACRLPYIHHRGVGELEWQELEPGTRTVIPINNYLCRGAPDSVSSGSEWWETPGDYVLKASVTHQILPDALEQSSGSLPRDGAREWTVRARPLELSVQEAVGIDSEAFQWARAHGHRPVSVEVANEFPSSRYSALLVHGLLTIHDGDPAQAKEYIDKGVFPGRTLVPDALSPDGQRVIQRGAEVASWRIEQGERLLREQKDFPYEQDVRLSVAVSYAVLGETDKAKQMLMALAAEEEAPEGQWAQRFLTVQGW